MKISHFRYWLTVSNHLYSNIPEVLNNEQINIGFFASFTTVHYGEMKP